MRFTFASTLPLALLLASTIPSISAIFAPPTSQCTVKCGNVQDHTAPADIACGDGEFSTQPGQTQKDCVQCQLNSTKAETGQVSDLEAAVYNLRYTAGFCTFNHSVVSDTPCITTFACWPLRNALNLTTLALPTSTTEYGFCDSWDATSVFRCQQCLRGLGGQMFLINHITALTATCQQKPARGGQISIDGSIFDTNVVTIGDPSKSAAAVASTFHPHEGISNGAIVGIACAGLVVLLILAGCFVICRGRRRRRAYLANYQSEKEGNAYTGGDMSQIPRWKQKQMQIQRDIQASRDRDGGSSGSPHSAGSQAGISKPSNWIWPSPLIGRREDHSPVSAVEPPTKTWSPYLSPDSGRAPQNPTFSPYISHLVSPVSPVDAPAKNAQWGAVPIPKPYRRGSLSSMSGRLAEGEQIEMSPLASHVDVSRSQRPADRERSVERQMNTVNDFGRSPIAKSTSGSVRSGRSGRSFRDRVEGDESWRSHPGMVGFVPAPAPVIRHPSQRSGAHGRNVSVESIGEAL